MNFPEDLLSSFKRGRVRLFIGSGVSATANLTGWNTLIDHMREAIRRENRRFNHDELEEFLASADHLDIADVFKDVVKDHRYYRFLREHYRRAAPISEVHRLLAKLQVRTVFTTNYDKLLEVALREQMAMIPQSFSFRSNWATSTTRRSELSSCMATSTILQPLF
jgi:hypothetical protein